MWRVEHQFDRSPKSKMPATIQPLSPLLTEAANVSAQPRVLIAVRSACLVSTPLGLPISCSASICRFLLCFGFAGGFLAPDLTFPIK